MCNNGKGEKAQTKLMFGLEHKLDVKVGYTHRTSQRADLADILQLTLDISQNYSFITQLNLEEFFNDTYKSNIHFLFFCQYHIHKN